jgi:hypothetical protein
MSDEPVVDPAAPVAQPFVTKAELEQIIANQTTQFASIFQRLTETLAAPKPAAPAVADQPTFYNQPAEAASALFDAKMAPLKAAFVNSEKERQMSSIVGLPFFGDYAKEIQEVINSAPAEVVVTPGYSREVYNLVIGRHFEEVSKKQQELKARQPEFTETVSAGAPPAQRSNSLSADEKRAAEGMGVSEDDYK